MGHVYQWGNGLRGRNPGLKSETWATRLLVRLDGLDRSRRGRAYAVSGILLWTGGVPWCVRARG